MFGVRRTALLTVTIALTMLLATIYGCSQANQPAEKHQKKERGGEVAKGDKATASLLTVADSSQSSSPSPSPTSTASFEPATVGGKEGIAQSKANAQAYLDAVDRLNIRDDPLLHDDLALVACRLNEEAKYPAPVKPYGTPEQYQKAMWNKIEELRKDYATHGKPPYYSYAADHLDILTFEKECGVLWDKYFKAGGKRLYVNTGYRAYLEQ